MRAILHNPGYTGHQVWNRQRREEVLLNVEDVALGHEIRIRWNPSSQWIWSEQPTHAPLVDTDTFHTAQKVFGGAQRVAVRREKTKRPYVLSGMVRCGVCGRRMQGSQNHGRGYYRCKFPAEYAVTEHQHAKTVYVREEAILPPLDRWLAGLFNDKHIDSTCQALAAASQAASNNDGQTHQLDLRRRLKECEAKLVKYRAALEHNPNITVVADWIAEVDRERKAIERDLGRTPTTRRLTKNEVRALVDRLGEIADVLAGADPEDKRGAIPVNLARHPPDSLCRQGALRHRILTSRDRCIHTGDASNGCRSTRFPMRGQPRRCSATPHTTHLEIFYHHNHARSRVRARV